jgi:hypothetical protein
MRTLFEFESIDNPLEGWKAGKVDDGLNLISSASALIRVSTINPGQPVTFTESRGLTTTNFINTWLGGTAPGFRRGHAHRLRR